MSVDFKGIVGNDELKSRISRDISEKTLSHAYIIEGHRGIGRHTFAYNIAAALACTSEDNIPCGECRNCKKILSFTSPDVITVGLEEDKATISVEAIRAIRDDMPIAPNDLETKVYIIEDADLMTVQAQNALLLSLEEPPSYVLFFLLCENSSSLLETIRSRAPSLRLQLLSDGEVEKYLLQNDKRAVQLKDEDEEIFRTVIHAAGGRIGYALELLDARRRKALLDERRISQSIISLLQNPNRAEVLGVIASLGKTRNEVIKNLISIEYAVRDLMVLKKAENARLCFYYDKEYAQEISTHFTSIALMSLYDAITDTIADLDAGANVRLTVLNMMQKAGLI